MTADDFRAWRGRLGLTQAQAAAVLGLSARRDGMTSDAVRHYERGSRAVSETVSLLCRYVERYGVLTDTPPENG